MTNIDREVCLVASILESPHAKLGPVTCTALAFWNYWSSPEASKLAEGIGKVIGRGKVPSRAMVKAAIGEYKDWLDHPLFNEPKAVLPPSCWETLAGDLLPRFNSQRVSVLIADANLKVQYSPHKATDIARKLHRELEGVLS